jgi:hypothetical protein
MPSLTTAVLEDSNGDVIVSGYYKDTIIWDNVLLNSPNSSPGSFTAYISKFDPTGSAIWSISPGHRLRTMSYATKVVSDRNNNIYVAGLFKDTILFNSPNYLVSSVPNRYNVFLAKYNASGVFQWVIHGNNNLLGNEWPDLTIDSLGYLYLSGDFSPPVDNSILNLGNLNVVSNRSTNGFIAKVDTSGMVLWLHATSNTLNSNGVVHFNSITNSNCGHIYVTG